MRGRLRWSLASPPLGWQPIVGAGAVGRITVEGSEPVDSLAIKVDRHDCASPGMRPKAARRRGGANPASGQTGELALGEAIAMVIIEGVRRATDLRCGREIFYAAQGRTPRRGAEDGTASRGGTRARGHGVVGGTAATAGLLLGVLGPPRDCSRRRGAAGVDASCCVLLRGREGWKRWKGWTLVDGGGSRARSRATTSEEAKAV